jgi:hypothetical protein
VIGFMIAVGKAVKHAMPMGGQRAQSEVVVQDSGRGRIRIARSMAHFGSGLPAAERLVSLGGSGLGVRRRLERFAEVCQRPITRGLAHPGLLPLANRRFEVSRFLPAISSEPDVAAARWALEGKLLPPAGP